LDAIVAKSAHVCGVQQLEKTERKE
jgi:hypothetical protein